MAENELIIIGLDPGTVDTGIAFAEADGRLISTHHLHVPKSWKAMRRILAIAEEVREQTEALVVDPSSDQFHLAYEQPQTFTGFGQFGQGVGRPVIALHQLVAVLEYLALKSALDITTFCYPIGEIKEGVTGDRSASKATVQQLMRLEYNLPFADLSEHEWDAMSIMTHHLSCLKIQSRIIS